MISFAANREDVRLARVLTAPRGTYLDVGAHHPIDGSVTKHFYDRGWRGVNVEPSPSLFRVIETARPDDVNVRAAAGRRAGTARFHFFRNAPGLSTVESRIADDHALMLGDPEVHDVEVVTLADLCREHVGDKSIDLLVVDVEGAEGAVLEGADFAKWRPRVVVVEATKPLTRTAAHDGFEPILLDADYRLAAFDGCNRFYVDKVDAAWAAALADPICYFDRFVDYETLRLVGDLAARVVDSDDGDSTLRTLVGVSPRAIADALVTLDLGPSSAWLRRVSKS